MGMGCGNRKGKIAGCGNLVCIPPLICSQAMSVKEVKPVKFCPLSLSYIVRLFRFYYLSLGKRNQITEVTSRVH